MTYTAEAAAIASLQNDGFAFRDGFWTKRGQVDSYHGHYMGVALCTVEHRRVDPQWNAPDYFEIKFH
jgi:hypothetical protein